MSAVSIHKNALVETKMIGKDTRIWAFAHILPGAVIGDDCNICDHTFIENNVTIGNRVTIKSGVQLWDGIVLEDDVFIGPNATFTNDPFPRSKHYPEKYSKTLIKKGASIGANATILPGITIGQYGMVGAGSVVTRDVPSYAIVAGNPARIIGYADAISKKVINQHEPTNMDEALPVTGAILYHLPLVQDLRGDLTFAEIDGKLPFLPQRFFFVINVPNKEIRGEHAHRLCHQFLVCPKGCCSVVLDDTKNRIEILLDRPNLGLYIPPMVWATEYKYSDDAVLMVLASDKYDDNDYIRDYNEYLDEIKKQ